MNKKVVTYINDVVSPNCSAVPAADPAGASEFYHAIDELEEQLLYGGISAADAAAMAVENCPADLK